MSDGGPHWAVMPLKLLTEAKQRLAGALSAEARQQLALAMAEDVLVSLRRCSEIDQILIVSRNEEAQQLADRYQAQVFQEPESADLPAALRAGITFARRAGAASVSLVPADIPAVKAQDFAEAIRCCDEVLIAPDDRYSGTNLLMLRPPDAIPPIFDGTSFRPHLHAALKAQRQVRVFQSPGLALDIDTPEDLERLRSLGGAQNTMALLKGLAPKP